MSKLKPLAGQRQKGESSKAVQACNDYLRMGAGRSLRGLSEKYNSIQQDSTGNPPTRSFGTLGQWSLRYSWVERAVDYDAEIEAQKTAYANEMMRSGIALDYERVGKLKDLFELLYEQLMEEGDGGVLHNLWLPDVKQIGSGEYAERVDIERYNSPLISDILRVLDDLAKETGGRVKKSEVTGEDGGDITVVIKGLDD